MRSRMGLPARPRISHKSLKGERSAFPQARTSRIGPPGPYRCESVPASPGPLSSIDAARSPHLGGGGGPRGTDIPVSVEPSLTTARGRGGSGAQERLARLLASTAGLGAHPAVLVVVGVALALRSTAPAGIPARRERGAGEVGVVTGLARQDAAGGVAEIGAPEVGGDATPELTHRLLPEARVCTCGAGRHAVEARLDARGERLRVVAGRRRVRTEHVLGNGHGWASLLVGCVTYYPCR